MKRWNAFAVALATVLTTTAASADTPPRDDTQAPRGLELQAPRDRYDEVQAPRGLEETQVPRGQAAPAPRR